VVFIPVIAVLLLGVDAWMVVATRGWEAKAEDLRSDSTDLGDTLAHTRADLEFVEAETEVVGDQSTAAEARTGELADEAAQERAQWEAFRDVSYAFEQCAADRLLVVRGLWEHGRAFVADLSAQSVSECAAAQATLDVLLAAGG
jgi:hypothetical protein